jgi:4-amino-4-deoxy-L-arabinose transferase-like glycosyltransferase
MHNRLNFFQPEVYSYDSYYGKAACEFPVIYYFIAILNKLFGEHEYYLRVINLSIISLGFYHLFHLSCRLLRSVANALIFVFLFFSSTVLLYYSNNFLPDAPALGFTFSGWYFFYRYFYERSIRPVIWATVFFTLASLIKVTYFINPIAAFAALLLHDLLDEKDVKRTLRRNGRYITGFLISLAAVVGWYLYVAWYSARYHSEYFLTHSRPLWQMTNEEINEAWDYIRENWVHDYLYGKAILVITVLSIVGLVIGKVRDILYLQAVFLLIGSACYLVLFFHQFHYHDYYALALCPALLFLALNGWVALQGRFRIARSFIAMVALAALCISGLTYSRKYLGERNNMPYDATDGIAVKLKNGRQLMHEANVPDTATVILLGYYSPNAGLYYLDRRGWCVPDTSEWTVGRVRDCITWGASYIVATDKAYVQKPGIAACLGEKRLERNGVLVYTVRKP